VIFLKYNDRKHEILISAFNILSKEGIANITLKKVAAEANIAIGLILHYYKNKEHLINEVIDYVLIQCEKFYSPEIYFSNPNPREEFLKVLDNLFSLSINDYVSTQAYYSVFISSVMDSDLKSKMLNSTYRYRKNIGFYLDFFKRKGIINYSDESAIVSHLLIVLEGLSYYKDFCSEEYFFEESVKAQRDLFLKMINFK
jgi:AcrR family transcriptional regulator